ncbi:MAG: type II toxin-antitoxin system RelE/ParE family toxin [Ginsengibacter sp.]
MVNRPIHWDRIALKQFADAIGFFARDSIQNAEQVHLEIINKIEALPANPEIYPADKYKLNNNGLYRALEPHRLRIAYYIASDKVRILQVRHSSRQPKIY